MKLKTLLNEVLLKEETFKGVEAVGTFMRAEKLTVDGNLLDANDMRKIDSYMDDLTAYSMSGVDEPNMDEINKFISQFAGKNITDEEEDKLEFTEKDIKEFLNDIESRARFA